MATHHRDRGIARGAGAQLGCLPRIHEALGSTAAPQKWTRYDTFEIPALGKFQAILPQLYEEIEIEASLAI